MAQRGILRYDLTDAEAKSAFNRAVKSGEMSMLIWRLGLYLSDLRDAGQTAMVQDIIDKFAQLKADYCINDDELID